MIEVKIDMVPFGVEKNRNQIGYIKIWNDATGDSEIGNYGYRIIAESGKVKKEGKYKNFQRNKGIFELLQAILNNAL